MSRLDAIYEEDANAARRVSVAVRDLTRLCVAAKVAIAQGAIPSSHALVVKAKAVDEATRMWDATRMATRRSEIDAWGV